MTTPRDDSGSVKAWCEELSTALERINCGIIGRDADSCILFVNERILKWTQYERDELVGQPLHVLFAPELEDATRAEVRATEQGDLRARLSAMRRKDSTTFPVLIIPETFENHTGRHRGIVSVLIDLGTIDTAKQVAGVPARSLGGRLEQIARQLRSLSLTAGSAPGAVPLSHPDLETLSRRETEVLTRIASGKRTPTIARELHISPHTVRNHLKSIYRKLGVRSQSELVDRLRGLERSTWPE